MRDTYKSHTIDTSNTPITTKLEEHLNKLLAHLGAENDIQTFMPQFTRAIITAIRELESANQSPIDAAHLINNALQNLERLENNHANMHSIPQIEPHALPHCWVSGVENHQPLLAHIAQSLHATVGHPKTLPLTIAQNLDVFISDTAIGRIINPAPAYALIVEKTPITTTAKLVYSTRNKCWCIHIGSNKA